MSGVRTQQEASDDREVERILKMTDEEVIAEAGGPEAVARLAEETRAIIKDLIDNAERIVRTWPTSDKP